MEALGVAERLERAPDQVEAAGEAGQQQQFDGDEQQRAIEQQRHRKREEQQVQADQVGVQPQPQRHASVSCIAFADAMPFEAPVQRGARQTERLGDARDVAEVLLHRRLDHVALDLFERHAVDAEAVGGAAVFLLGGDEVGLGQLAFAAQEQGALERLLELADVARPRLGAEPLHRLRRDRRLAEAVTVRRRR